MDLQNTVKEALNALYHHPDDAVRAQADRWLQDFQHSIDAWQVTPVAVDPPFEIFHSNEKLSISPFLVGNSRVLQFLILAIKIFVDPFKWIASL